MSAWILIITIFTTGSGAGKAIAVEHIEMSGKQRCIEAATFYKENVAKSGNKIFTTCIKK